MAFIPLLHARRENGEAYDEVSFTSAEASASMKDNEGVCLTFKLNEETTFWCDVTLHKTETIMSQPNRKNELRAQPFPFRANYLGLLL